MHTVRTLKVKSQMRRNRKCGNQMVMVAGGVADPSLILNFKLSTMTTTEGFAPQPSFPAAIFPRLSPWFSARDFVLELPSSCLFFYFFFLILPTCGKIISAQKSTSARLRYSSHTFALTFALSQVFVFGEIERPASDNGSGDGRKCSQVDFVFNNHLTMNYAAIKFMLHICMYIYICEYLSFFTVAKQINFSDCKLAPKTKRKL